VENSKSPFFKGGLSKKAWDVPPFGKEGQGAALSGLIFAEYDLG
jgi:hypothetical protein